ncbi:hypothetical protein MATL_G00149610 [Megalops atlanticus]|uniref:Cilia- and flagella-associated protein 97 n=1 Tax=Megalops atlanticus TaxID=7932 RepID=A0A9D3PRX0_MEGAT|nr:hypothetical protein MATL_G00149610 [Megalops atlanticus]
MQHRAYQPLLPCGNKYLQHKWDKTCYDMHKKKVKSAKPTISTTPPQTYGHLQLKMKKLKLEEERIAIIQRDNDMLLEKISFIMRTTGRIDNRNLYENRSLSSEKRQRELLRVTKENQIILERLSRCGPRYSVQQWQEDWLRTERYMESIARYPRSAALKKAQPKSMKQTAKEGKKEESKKEESHSEEEGQDDDEFVDGNKDVGKTEQEGSSGMHGAEIKTEMKDNDSHKESDQE